MSNNYYMASKVIIPHGYYENVVKNSISTNSTIVVDNEGVIPKIKAAAEKLGVELPFDPITMDEYVYMMEKRSKNDISE